MPRPRCHTCGRPQRACYCEHVTPITTRTKIIILQHPRESRVAINTARIARLCLPQAELLVGTGWGDDSQLAKQLQNPAREPFLLYPGPGARDISELHTNKPVTLVVIDGTWSQSRAVVRNSPALGRLPRYAFVPERESEYRIRREPRPDFVSTIEALVNVLGRLEGDKGVSTLLQPFRAMVDFQLSCVKLEHVPRRRLRPKHKPQPPRIPSALVDLWEDIVCVAAGANAWPRGTAHGRELVQWLAMRPHSGERLGCLRAPSIPLAPLTPERLGLSAAQLMAGDSPQRFRHAWRAWLRDSDVLCGWGYFPVDMLRDAGGSFPGSFIDLRAVAKRWSGKRWATMQQFHDTIVQQSTTAAATPAERDLACAVAIARFLVDRGREERAGQGAGAVA